MARRQGLVSRGGALLDLAHVGGAAQALQAGALVE
jgi:hypothetical protein